MPKVIKIQTQNRSEPVVPQEIKVDSPIEAPILNETDREREQPKELPKKPEIKQVVKNGNKSITFEKVKPIQEPKSPEPVQ